MNYSSPNDYPKDIYHALYEDENGEVITLDEVQYLDPVENRTRFLQDLLNHDDLYIQYQAALILAAWADEEGLDKLEEFVDSRIDKKIEVSPHRINGDDNVYDEIAKAIKISAFNDSTGIFDNQRRRIVKKLLKLYGECYFESNLKYLLLDDALNGNDKFKDLLPDVEKAFIRCVKMKRNYLASQLLPVIAKWQSSLTYQFINAVRQMPAETPNPANNLAEALRFIPSPQSVQMLTQLKNNSDEAVRSEAEKSLSVLTS